jgi:glutathione peroxidase
MKLLSPIHRLLPLLALAAGAAGWSPPAPAQAAPAAAGATAAALACPALLNQTVNRLQDEKPQALCQYAGKVLLVVNTASYCGFTPQYQGLEALHAKYAAQGLVVLGFPSNDFSQEPGQGKEIADFCYNTYGVKFPMFTKTSVVGKGASPLFAALAKATGEAPDWNFHKYLIDRQGRAVASFDTRVTPDNVQLVSSIEKALAQK